MYEKSLTPRDILSLYPGYGINLQFGIIDPDELLTKEERTKIQDALMGLKKKGKFPYIFIIDNLIGIYEGKEGFLNFITELSFFLTPSMEDHSNVIVIGINIKTHDIELINGNDINNSGNDDLDKKSLIKTGNYLLSKNTLTETILKLIDLCDYYLDKSYFDKKIFLMRILIFIITSLLITIISIFVILSIYYNFFFLNKEEMEILKKIKNLLIKYENDESTWKNHCLICLNSFDFNTIKVNFKKTKEKLIEERLNDINIHNINESEIYPNNICKSQENMYLGANCLKKKCNHFFHRECLLKMKKFCASDCIVCDVLCNNSINHLKFRENIIFIQQFLFPKLKNLNFYGYGKYFTWKFNYLCNKKTKDDDYMEIVRESDFCITKNKNFS